MTAVLDSTIQVRIPDCPPGDVPAPAPAIVASSEVGAGAPLAIEGIGCERLEHRGVWQVYARVGGRKLSLGYHATQSQANHAAGAIRHQLWPAQIHEATVGEFDIFGEAVDEVATAERAPMADVNAAHPIERVSFDPQKAREAAAAAI